jgi:hypothetical protein
VAAVESLGLVDGWQAKEGDDHIGPPGEGDRLLGQLLVAGGGVDAVPGGEVDLHALRDGRPQFA